MQVKTWLEALLYLVGIASAVHGAKLDELSLTSILNLLDRIAVRSAKGVCLGLSGCFAAIKAEIPELEQVQQFKKLANIVRTIGGELNRSIDLPTSLSKKYRLDRFHRAEKEGEVAFVPFSLQSSYNFEEC